MTFCLGVMEIFFTWHIGAKYHDDEGSRTNMYQSLSEDRHPAFETIAKVANSLGYKLVLVSI